MMLVRIGKCLAKNVDIAWVLDQFYANFGGKENSR